MNGDGKVLPSGAGRTCPVDDEDLSSARLDGSASNIKIDNRVVSLNGERQKLGRGLQGCLLVGGGFVRGLAPLLGRIFPLAP